MPDVVRSDSQRSDASLRPRVSFNRDVHVKRIVPSERKGSLNTEENSYSLRKGHSRRSRKEIAEDADPQRGSSAGKFYSLPRTRRENEELNRVLASLDRELMINNKGLETKPPKKPQRIFATQYKTQGSRTPTGSLKKSVPRTHLHRSVSDASNTKPKLLGNLNEKNRTSSKQNLNLNSLRSHKKQLSPIVEQTPREDYFAPTLPDNYKENNINVNNHKNEQVKERDGRKNKKRSGKKDEKKIIVIDIDKAEDISKTKRSKLKASLFGKKLRSIATKRNRKKGQVEERAREIDEPPPTRIEEAIESLKNQVTSTPKMIHSSQKPVEKPPLTRGRTVDLMVRRLNNDNSLPPPKPNNVLVTPNQNVQHNNNQPFSYTRGLSPEKLEENVKSPGVPVIYAQVVCNSDQNGSAKQTIHKSYPKRYSQSDSDEGLGIEEGLIRTKEKSPKQPKHFTHFGDDIQMKMENPITPKYKVSTHNGYEMHYSSHDSDNFYLESCQRGCGDGMEAKRRESSLEKLRNGMETDESDSNRNNLSVRRDLLESRINQKINHSRTESKFERSASSSPSPISNMRQNRKYSSDLDSSKHYYSIDEPKSFDSNISDSYNESFLGNKESEYRRYESKQRTIFSKNLCKSTPDIYHRTNERPSHHQHSYHDSLQRDKYRTNRMRNDKDKFGDSGIENDIKRESIANLSSQKSHLHYTNNYAESEDEGFASSLLIANDKQHAKNHVNRKLSKKDYDSDMTFSGEDDAYRNNVDTVDYKVAKDCNDEYVPRERSIDDGSHFDPRIDKDVEKENTTLKRNAKKSQKTEKKSSLEKVKQLFTRDNKKKKENNMMVREESLLARYTEYKGSNDYSEPKRDNDSDEISKSLHHSNRKRLPTPSPNSSPVHDLETPKKTPTPRTSWFKSLDRLSRNTLKKKEPKTDKDPDRPPSKRPSPKTLRFFGDTDSDSDRLKSHSILKERATSQSSRDLHNISEDSEPRRKPLHKSLLNVSEGAARSRAKPPISPGPKAAPPKAGRRRRPEPSSVESSTEGDGSQQSQKSVVYLHAATVGDIPGPAALRYASKEELAPSDSGRIQAQSKRISRSFSVLAPWRPRQAQEARQIDYSQRQGGRKEAATLARAKGARSRESLSKSREEAPAKAASTLYKKRERVPREYLRYSKEKEERKSAKYRSAESLRNNGTGGRKGGDLSRSVSMPKDPERAAGWYKEGKKEHHKSDYIAQRV